MQKRTGKNSDSNGFSFTQDDVRQVLSSKEGQRLLSLLQQSGGTVLQNAANAAKSGDMETVQRLLSPMLQNDEAADLMEKINRKRG